MWRDLKVRYRQTALGVAWAVLQPLALMAIVALVFGRLAKLPSDGVPYTLFAFVGLLPWTLFAAGVGQAANSVVGSAPLVTKTYLPRILLPVAAITAPLLDFAVATLLLVPLMAFHGVGVGPEALVAPAFVALALVAALGLGLVLAAVNVQFRDVRFVVPFMLQLWLFATPVAYASSLVPDGWRTAYALNPMASVVDGLRWSLLGASPPGLGAVAASVSVAVGALAIGLVVFARREPSFADYV